MVWNERSNDMPAALQTRDQIIETLTSTFRRYGYDGTSLARLSEATGLGRSSLYHYFPKGKEDMAEAVMEHAFAWGAEIGAPFAEDGPPRERLVRVLEGIDRFYDSGRTSCLMDLFAIGDASPLFRKALEARMRGLMSALSRLAEEAGIPPAEAARRGEDAVVAIQGSLVVSRVFEDGAPFRRALQALPDRLLQPQPA